MRLRHPGAMAMAATAILALSACSAGDLGSSDSDGGGGKVTLTYSVGNSEASVRTAEQVTKDFMAKNPDITLKIDPRPEGGEGDNLPGFRRVHGERLLYQPEEHHQPGCGGRGRPDHLGDP